MRGTASRGNSGGDGVNEPADRLRGKVVEIGYMAFLQFGLAM